jgi:hypothetical protein
MPATVNQLLNNLIEKAREKARNASAAIQVSL